MINLMERVKYVNVMWIITKENFKALLFIRLLQDHSMTRFVNSIPEHYNMEYN